MRILFATIGRYPHIGGKSSHIQMLADGLNGLGTDAEIISTSMLPFIKRAMISDAPRLILDSITRGQGLYWSYKSRAVMLAEEAERLWSSLGEIDIYHAHDVPAMDIVSRLRSLYPERWARVPSVLTVHGDAANEYLSEGKVKANSKVAGMLYEQECRAYSIADAIIAVDNRLRDHVRSASPGADIHVIPNTVDTDFFSPVDTEKRNMARSEFTRKMSMPSGADTTGFLILCPRRLVPKNGVDVAIRALKLLTDEVMNRSDCFPYLICAGDGPESSRLSDIAKNLGLNRQVIFLGNIPHSHIVDLYRISDAVVVPSITSQGVIEATSISALEAMSVGLPVVASDIGGLSQLIRHDDTGFLFPEGDAAGLAQLLRILITDAKLRNAVGFDARRYVEEKHGKAIGNKSVIDLYKKLLSEA